MKKRVDVILKYFYPVAAGIETNTLETYSVMAKNGWDVTIHTSKDDHTVKDVYKDFEEYRGLKIKRYSFSRFGYSPNIDYKNTDIVALHNFDIFPHFLLLIKYLLMKIMGQKKFGVILTPHGGFNPEWSIFTKLQVLIKRTYHFTIGTLLINSVVDRMRAVSEWERNEIIGKRVFSRKVVTISNGLEDQAFVDVDKLASNDIKQKVKKLGKYIIQIGRVYPIKNYETTLKALAKSDKNLNYVIAGPIASNEYKAELDVLIKKLGIEKRVHFVGIIRGIDKYYLIKKSVAMVHMAIWESFCNVVHEGMSQGKVCIVANNTALPLLIHDGVNGFCVETKDVSTLSKRIAFVLDKENAGEVEKMAEINKEKSKEHRWSNVADKMDKTYREVIIEVQGGGL
jgi:glycosyltransferase involved in cell wall biosynthesis